MKSKIENGVLKHVDPSDLVDGVFQCDAVIAVASEAFIDCRDFLKEVILNNAIKLHKNALSNCQMLNKCKFPKVQKIGR